MNEIGLVEIKRKRGRPKGSLSKKKRVTPGEKAEIKRLFISGESLSKIMKKFNLSSSNWIYSIIDKEKWFEERDRFFQQGSKQYLDELLSKTMEEMDKTLFGLKIIREKAITPIEEGTVVPHRFSESSDAYIDAVKLERMIRAEGLHLSFVSEIAIIVRKRVDSFVMKKGLPLEYSSELLSEIGQDVRETFNQRMMLISGGRT